MKANKANSQPAKGFIDELASKPRPKAKAKPFDYREPVVKPAPTDDMQTLHRAQRQTAVQAPKSNMAKELSKIIQGRTKAK